MKKGGNDLPENRTLTIWKSNTNHWLTTCITNFNWFITFTSSTEPHQIPLTELETNINKNTWKTPTGKQSGNYQEIVTNEKQHKLRGKCQGSEQKIIHCNKLNDLGTKKMDEGLINSIPVISYGMYCICSYKIELHMSKNTKMSILPTCQR